ncbi:membrane protein [Paenibacillus swuensis]|uniref:Membrane protein n=1 Tax=Paenibacillus swuensis TaxID=1178515 RepID=A0A172TNS6_9BACL|nr:membrane protein [Paenibacillus swuensis]
MHSELETNITNINRFFEHCSDLQTYRFKTGHDDHVVIMYFDGLADKELMDTQLIRPLKGIHTPAHHLEALEELTSAPYIRTSTYIQTIDALTSGKPVMFMDNLSEGRAFQLVQFEKRAIEEPQAESVVRGPREGFTEVLSVNLSLLRRRLRTPALKIVSVDVGVYSKVTVTIAYIEGIVKPGIVELIQKRLQSEVLDGVVESGMIEELIEDTNYSPFPQLQTTERPDVAVASMLEGRVVVLTENTPIALIAPTTMVSLMQSPEDYYQRFMTGTFIRWLRYLFFFIALLAPSSYVAILTFHQEMLPTTLLLRIAQSREEIPFPALLEALIMEVTFEALREAGIRLPKQVGSAVSIVGALVIGQAAIQAGLVSAPMVMVVAITGISSFMLPQYSASFALRILRFPIMILSGMFGLFGMMLCLLAIITHLCGLQSFGVPYMAPLGPLRLQELKDVLIRAPFNKMKKRPSYYSNSNRKRRSN